MLLWALGFRRFEEDSGSSQSSGVSMTPAASSMSAEVGGFSTLNPKLP